MKRTFSRRGQQGMTIVELMVAMVLGLFVIGGFISVFISSLGAFRSNEGLARIQENGRIGSELMLREIRSAGGTACGTKLVSNVLGNPASAWWSDWALGSVRGVEGNQAFSGVTTGTATAQRVVGTDLLVLLNTTAFDGVNITGHNTSSAVIDIDVALPGIEVDDVLMVCDSLTAAMFQVSHLPGSAKIGHNAGIGTPGNCSKGLGYPPVCTTNGNQKSFIGGTVAKLDGSFWYVGNNGRGTRSLYRRVYDAAAPQEVVEGVHDLQIDYLRADTASANALDITWKTATEVGIAGWTDSAAERVVAVRIQLTLMSNETVTTDAQRLERTFVHVVRLRNREVL